MQGLATGISIFRKMQVNAAAEVWSDQDFCISPEQSASDADQKTRAGSERPIDGVSEFESEPQGIESLRCLRATRRCTDPQKNDASVYRAHAKLEGSRNYAVNSEAQHTLS